MSDGMTSEGSVSTSKRVPQSERMARPRPEGGPVVIDLGKKRRKQVKELCKGEPGKLLNEVRSTIETLRAQNAIASDAQTVIVVVREKRRKGGDLFGF